MIRIPKAIEKLMRKTVPVLCSTDMYKGDFDSPKGTKHCLGGWVIELFASEGERDLVCDFIRKEIRKEYPYQCSIPEYNDDFATLVQAARIFNRAMEAMGYTEDC